MLRLCCSAVFLFAAATARAQAVQFEPAQGGEVIVDPELAAQAPPSSEPPATTIAAPSEQSAEVRAVLRSRFGIDVEWQDAREDVIEATQLMLIEARIRRSERLAFSVGVRAQHRTLSREGSTPDAGPVRYELDAAPTAAYADVGITDEVHTRLGYQGVHLGRFDVLGASDVLSRYDLRSGPTVMPEQSEVAQPAISADWDIAQGYAVRGIYVPFFAPHMFHALDGDYAFPLRQADVDDAFNNAVFMQDWRDYARLWREALSRSEQAELGEGALAAFAPDPSLGNPQAALRFTAHGPAGEIALTAATALEHLPTVRLDPYVEDPGSAREPILVPRLRYGRFGLISIDGATDIGPVQVGLEVALTTDRALYAVNERGQEQVRESDVLHTALRAELVEGDDLVLALEASCATMLADPADDQDWQLTVGRRYQIAAIAFAGYSINAIDLRLELGGGVLVGPTYLITPRAELRLWDQLYGEVGAYIIGGKGERTDANATLGALYDDVDQVFAGLRWLI